MNPELKILLDESVPNSILYRFGIERGFSPENPVIFITDRTDSEKIKELIFRSLKKKSNGSKPKRSESEQHLEISPETEIKRSESMFLKNPSDSENETRETKLLMYFNGSFNRNDEIVKYLKAIYQPFVNFPKINKKRINQKAFHFSDEGTTYFNLTFSNVKESSWLFSNRISDTKPNEIYSMKSFQTLSLLYSDI